MKMLASKKYNNGIVKGILKENKNTYFMKIIDFQLISDDKYDEGIPMCKRYLNKNNWKNDDSVKDFFKRKIDEYIKKLEEI